MTLFLVPCHAVLKQPLAENVDITSDSAWILQSFQAGEPRFYLEHIQAAIDAAEAENATVIMSGGQTRESAGPVSEALSYWIAARMLKLDVSRVILEEHSRDSFENVLFSLCRYHEFTGTFPERIEVFGWLFKEQRFDLHAKAIKWPMTKWTYHGVNRPQDLDGAMKGEATALQQFIKDPYGVMKPLLTKRISRNPFKRPVPYRFENEAINSLLNYKETDVFPQTLPWE